MANSAAAMTPEKFVGWMAENCYNPESLAADLDCNRVSVFRWKSGAHPISKITLLALQFLALDKRALGDRRRAEKRAERAQQEVEDARAARRA